MDRGGSVIVKFGGLSRLHYRGGIFVLVVLPAAYHFDFLGDQ